MKTNPKNKKVKPERVKNKGTARVPCDAERQYRELTVHERLESMMYKRLKSAAEHQANAKQVSQGGSVLGIRTSV